jgi:hypothetical protein
MCIFLAVSTSACSSGDKPDRNPPDTDWQLEFSDPGTGDWTDGWFLEGDRATVENTPAGMILSAGPPEGMDSSHAVLWTRQSFTGDLKIQYEYTRLDTVISINAVNILYIHATGLGTEESPVDIARSSESRRIPTMSKYYLGMNALHISYATTGPRRSHYVSSRRYPATSQEAFPEETQLQPIYEDVELFEPGRTYQITVIKKGDRLSLLAEWEDESRLFEWDTTQFPDVHEGRIGLRHMRGRSARYRNFRVHTSSQPPLLRGNEG